MTEFKILYGKESKDISSDAEFYAAKLLRKKILIAMASLIHVH